tara:strand:- start:308 stop:619 length:312 start_codon:yes stop_codon:yes gene_type:complete
VVVAVAVPPHHQELDFLDNQMVVLVVVEVLMVEVLTQVVLPQELSTQVLIHSLLPQPPQVVVGEPLAELTDLIQGLLEVVVQVKQEVVHQQSVDMEHKHQQLS